MKFFTIGVYNSTKEDFFNKLSENKIDTFCDIRRRRGVRGAKYAFVNSKRLQKKLDELEIKYGHVIDLAPTNEIRELQKEADAQKKEMKRSRNSLGEVFSSRYKSMILEKFDFESFIESLENVGAKRVVLFCVEEKAQACHRSLVADKLKELGYEINHI